jgi:hypothetical protein
MPAWSMAAAAMLVFGIGVAGGFAGRVIAARTVAPAEVQAAATQPPPGSQSVKAVEAAATTPSVSLDDFRALQSRIGNMERAALTRPATSAASASNAEILAQVEQLIRESEGRVNHKTSQRFLSMMQDIDRQRTRDTVMLQQQISDMQERTNGSILAVKNGLRTEKEKE